LRERVPAIDYVDMRFDDRVYVRPAAATVPKPSLDRALKRGKDTQPG
jgi:hypothetical protein